MRRLGDFVSAKKLRTGEVFLKFCRVKKACYSGFVSNGFPSKIPVKSRKIRDDNRRTVHSFRSFIYPVYSLPTQQDSVLPVTRASKIRLHCRLNGALILFWLWSPEPKEILSGVRSPAFSSLFIRVPRLHWFLITAFLCLFVRVNGHWDPGIATDALSARSVNILETFSAYQYRIY